MNPVLGNIIFPLLFTPYAMALLMPAYGISALVAEVVTFCALQFRAAPLWKLIVAVTAANCVSTLVGVAFAFIPSPTDFGKVLAISSFFVLWALTVAVEYGVYVGLSRWCRLPHLLRTVLISNSISYAIIMIGMFHSWIDTTV
jgi:hypothetical protein